LIPSALSWSRTFAVQPGQGPSSKVSATAFDPVVLITDPLGGGLVETGLADGEGEGVTEGDGETEGETDAIGAGAGIGRAEGPDATADTTATARIATNPPLARLRRNPGVRTPPR
jgi:hypothetical protein